MKKLFLATTAALALAAGSAGAADLARPVYKAPPPPPPIFSWTGFYVGAHVGAGWATTEADINSINFAGIVALNGFSIPVAQTQSNGFLGGGQVGANWQFAPWGLVGIEADASWTNLKGTSPCLLVLGCTTEHDWIATVSGRLGFTYDRALFYVKGGVAWAQTTYSANLNLGLLGAFTTSVDDTRVGALFGTGIEYAFLPNWSAKVEYNYIDFGHRDYIFPIAIGIPINVGSNIGEKMHTVKFGLNYRFGWGSSVY